MGSRRLSGKVMSDVAGRPLLLRVIERARLIAGIERVVVATSDAPADRPIRDLASATGVDAFAGSENDVLDRFYQAARCYGATTIVRLTADCPLLDPAVSARVVSRFFTEECDYASNVHPPTFPDGLDTEVFSFNALERTWGEARLPSEREHVTPYIWTHGDRFRVANVEHDRDLSHCRWTVDEPSDLAFVRGVYAALADRDGLFGLEEVLAALAGHPELVEMNAGHVRNAGYLASIRSDAH